MTKNIAALLLRWGLAFVFFYAAVASLSSPQEWIGYFPPFLIRLASGILSAKSLLALFSVYQMILAVFLFIGRKLIPVSLLATVSLAGIAVFNLGQLDIVFRDIGLMMAALALFEIARDKKNFIAEKKEETKDI